MSDAAQPAVPENGKPASSPLEDFLREFPDRWKRIPRKGLFFGLLVPWLALFHFYGNTAMGRFDTHSLYSWLIKWYEAIPDDQHGYLMPFAFLAFLWSKRDVAARSAGQAWLGGIFFFAFFALCHVVAHMIQQPRLSLAALLMGFYFLMGVAWGGKFMRSVFFPWVLLLFCIPMASFAEFVTLPLRIFVTNVSVGLSHHVFGVDVFNNGSQIMDAKGRLMYDVAPACSGMRSLVTLMVISLIHAFTALSGSLRRVALVALAVPIAVVGNIFRVTVVIMVGEAFGQKAGMLIEQKFGFVTFVVALILLFVTGRLLEPRAGAASKVPPAGLATPVPNEN